MAPTHGASIAAPPSVPFSAVQRVHDVCIHCVFRAKSKQPKPLCRRLRPCAMSSPAHLPRQSRQRAPVLHPRCAPAERFSAAAHQFAMSAQTTAISPLSLAISQSTTPNHPPPKRASHPSIAGRLHTRPSFSLTSFLSQHPSDSEQTPSSPTPQPPEHDPHNSRFHSRRRRKRPFHSRIARPKDAMPGFRRRRHFASRSKSAKFRHLSHSAPGGARHFDRAVSSATYYNRSQPVDAIETPDFAHVPPPLCVGHSEPAVLLTCRKAGKNRGRQFFKCANKSGSQCDYFRWADESGAPISDAEDGLGPPCVVAEASAVEPLIDDDPEALQAVLHRVFLHQSFRPAQEESIRRLLSARSTMALIPTGGGKSLIYQMYAAVRPGIVVVITPLLSLMQDQLESLPESLPGACLRSGQPLELQAETERRVCAGEVKILFISPERLFSNRFRRLMGADQAPIVSLVVVDEAHCISHWSHNFRVAYLRIPQALYGGRGIAPVFQTRPLVLALTATATQETLTDVCRSLDIDIVTDVVRSNNGRRNLVLSLSRVRGNIDGKAHELVRRFKMQPFASILGLDQEEKEEKEEPSDKNDSGKTNAESEDDEEPPRKKRRRTRKCEDDLSIGWGSNLNVTKRVRAQKNARRRKHTGSLIVYVTKQKDCEAVRNYFKVSTLSLQGKVEMYHGGMAQRDREKVQSQFEKGSVAILVATVAFGMGLNFSNVRGVVHFDMPPSLEAYWQEVGRAGRQGEEAYCTVLFSSFDLSRTLSRSHSDGIEKSQVRQFLKSLLSNMFELKSISQRTRTFLREQKGGEATSCSDKCTDADENLNEDDESSPLILRMTEYDLNRKLDMRFETAETICAILERELDEFHLLRPTNTKMKVRFFSRTPDVLIKSASKCIRTVDRMLIHTIIKHGSQSNGQYCLDLSDAGVQEVQVIGSLKRLQEGRHIEFEMCEKGIEVECSVDCFKKLRSEADKWVQHLYNKLEHIEEVRVRKARMVARTFSKADELLSDKEQSEFIHNSVAAYFKPGEHDGELGCAADEEELVREVGGERVKQIRRAVEAVMSEQSCGTRMARSGRQIARILHGIDSAAFRAKDWYSHRNWGRFVDVGFEQTKRIASDVVREQYMEARAKKASRTVADGAEE